MTDVIEPKPDVSTLDLTTLSKEELIAHVQELIEQNKLLKERLEEIEIHQYRGSEGYQNVEQGKCADFTEYENTFMESDQEVSHTGQVLFQEIAPDYVDFEEKRKQTIDPTEIANMVELVAVKGAEGAEPGNPEAIRPSFEVREVEAHAYFQQMTDLIRNMDKSPSIVLTEQEADFIQGQLLKKPAKEKYDLKLWEKEIIPFIKDKEAWDRIRPKIKANIHNSIPTKLRGKVWPKLIGNPLRIKRKVYDHYCQLLTANPTDHRVLYIIKEDLVRTYPFIKSFQRGEALNNELQCLLELFNFTRPDVGYIQGMAYPAAMLLLHMDRYHAFKCMVNMIVCSPFLMDLYSFDLDKLKVYFRAFDHYLEQRNPLSFKHLAKMGVQSDTYLIEWYYTLYCRAFTIHDAAKIWDMFLVDGEVVFLRIALRIFKAVEPQLLKKDYAQTLHFIRNCTVGIDIEILLKDMQNSRLTTERLEKFYEKDKKKTLVSGKSIST